MPVKSKAESRKLNATFGHAWVKRHHFDNSTAGLPEHLEKGGKVVAKKQTGKIRHTDMVMLQGSRGHGKADAMEHATHRKMNREHGMAAGMSPADGCASYGESENEGCEE